MCDLMHGYNKNEYYDLESDMINSNCDKDYDVVLNLNKEGTTVALDLNNIFNKLLLETFTLVIDLIYIQILYWVMLLMHLDLLKNYVQK